MPTFNAKGRRQAGARATPWLTLAIAGCFGLLVSTEVRAETTTFPAAVATLVLQSKTEGGKASIFGKPLNPQQDAEMSKRMSAFYGIPIELDVFSGLHSEKASAVVQSSKLGIESGIDIFWTASSIAGLLIQNDVIATYDWVKELNVDQSLRLGQYGMRTGDETLASVMYNTNLVRAEKAPKTFVELGQNPQWKGLIATPRTASTFIYISYGIGDDSTRQFMHDLITQQQLVMLPTYPDVRARVLSGEFAFGIGIDGILAKRSGAPAGLAPIDPMIVVPTGAWVMKDAKHPATGKLYAFWLTTPDGQKALYDILGISLVTTPGTDLNAHAAGKTVKVMSHDFVVTVMRERLPIYNQILGIR